MPTTDTATYDGIAVFGASNDTVGVALVGDASMTADFDAATISGTIDNFVGAENVTADEQGNFSDLDGNPLSVTDLFLSVKSASGEVSVNNGTISGSTFSADYASAVGIVMSGSPYHPHGTMAGDFIGSKGFPPRWQGQCNPLELQFHGVLTRVDRRDRAHLFELRRL
ncbi:MAG: hypothetical protein P8X50_07610 [Maritimibacter sp.]